MLTILIVMLMMCTSLSLRIAFLAGKACQRIDNLEKIKEASIDAYANGYQYGIDNCNNISKDFYLKK